LLVQVTVRTSRHPAKRSPKENWFREQQKKFQRKNRSRAKTKGLKDELKAVRAELQSTKDERDKYAARARGLELQNEILEEEVELDEGLQNAKDERNKYAARARGLELQNEILEEEVELDEGLQNAKDERNKYAARARGLELQNEILEEEVEIDEGSDGFKDIAELGRQDSQFTSDNDTHGIHIHDDDDEKVGPSTRLVTPSPPPRPETPKTPCHPRFTNKCRSCGAASMPTTLDSPNDDLNTGLPSGIGMREVEREKKGAEPAKSLFLGPRKEEGILELGTMSRRLAYKWMGTLDDFWNPFSSSGS
jgi:hypothetical protein